MLTFQDMRSTKAIASRLADLGILNCFSLAAETGLDLPEARRFVRGLKQDPRFRQRITNGGEGVEARANAAIEPRGNFVPIGAVILAAAYRALRIEIEADPLDDRKRPRAIPEAEAPAPEPAEAEAPARKVPDPKLAAALALILRDHRAGRNPLLKRRPGGGPPDYIFTIPPPGKRQPA